jgi:hypothetical protein
MPKKKEKMPTMKLAKTRKGLLNDLEAFRSGMERSFIRGPHFLKNLEKMFPDLLTKKETHLAFQEAKKFLEQMTEAFDCFDSLFFVTDFRRSKGLFKDEKWK